MNIIRAGILLIIYMFIVVTFYIVLSTPFEEVISGVEDINLTASDARVESSGTTLRIVFDMGFGLAALVPILWFVMWVFHREPDWGFRQR